MQESGAQPPDADKILIFQHSKYASMKVSANNGTHNHNTTPKQSGHNTTYNYVLPV